jgi:hypothetical protein
LRTERPRRSQALKPATWVGVKPRRPASCAISSVLWRLYEWNVARARSHARQPSELSRARVASASRSRSRRRRSSRSAWLSFRFGLAISSPRPDGRRMVDEPETS